MKKIYALLIATATFGMACDDATIAQLFQQETPAFSGEFQVFTDVKGKYVVSSETRSYISFDGEFFEADDFSTADTATATNCVIDGSGVLKTSSYSQDYERGYRVNRYVGSQEAILARAQQTTPAAVVSYNDFAVFGDYSYTSHMIYTGDPHLIPDPNSWVYEDQNGATYGENLSHYSDIEELIHFYEEWFFATINLFFYEEAEWYRHWVTDVTTQMFNSIVTTTTSISTNSSNNSSSRAWHFAHDGHIWEFTNIASVHDFSTTGDLTHLVPDGVAVGDTWISDASNNPFAAAVTVEDVVITDGVTSTTVQAIVIVLRGQTAFSTEQANIEDACVYFFNEEETLTTGQDVTDYVILDANIDGNCDGDEGFSNGDSLDWTNIATYWYYGGQIIKSSENLVETVVTEAGYARLNDQTGVCDTFTTTAQIATTDVENYVPYFKFTVEEREDSFIATNIEETNVLLDAFNNEFGESVTTSSTETTTTSE